jgi:nucleoside-diphosphate-sugar epimerase
MLRWRGIKRGRWVQGAGGFIGSHLARYLADEGVTSLVDNGRTVLVWCDLTNSQHVENVFHEYELHVSLFGAPKAFRWPLVPIRLTTL